MPRPSPDTTRHVFLGAIVFSHKFLHPLSCANLKPAQRLVSDAASKTHISHDAQTISDPHFLALAAPSYGGFRKELPPFQASALPKKAQSRLLTSRVGIDYRAGQWLSTSGTPAHPLQEPALPTRLAAAKNPRVRRCAPPPRAAHAAAGSSA